MPTEKVHFRNLDAIRFIAASMVVLAHAVAPAFAQLPIAGTAWDRLVRTVCSGGTGVSIFFVLSGFLITYLLMREQALTGRIAVKAFYMRRVLRIWPLYFLVVAISFGLYPLLRSVSGTNGPLGSHLLLHLFFLSNFDVIGILKHTPGLDTLSQNITWSVSIEEQFYLFWPWLFALFPLRWWPYAMLTVAAASIGFRVLHAGDTIVLYFHTLSVLMDLAIGGFMAWLIHSSVRVRSLFERTSTATHAGLFVLAFALCYRETGISTFTNGALAISRIPSSIVFALIIATQAFTRSGSLLEAGRWRFAERWGRYTYGIYLLHPIVLTMLTLSARALHLPMHGFAGSLLLGAGVLAGTLIVSKISYIHFESRFLRLKERFSVVRTSLGPADEPPGMGHPVPPFRNSASDR